MADQTENTQAPEAMADANPTLVVAVGDENLPAPAEDAPEAAAALEAEREFFNGEALEAKPENEPEPVPADTDTDTDELDEIADGLAAGVTEEEVAPAPDELDEIEALVDSDEAEVEEIAEAVEAEVVETEVIEETPATEAVQAEVVEPKPETPTPEAPKAEVVDTPTPVEPKEPTPPVPPVRPAQPTAPVAAAVAGVIVVTPRGPQGPQGPAGPAAPTPPTPKPTPPVPPSGTDNPPPPPRRPRQSRKGCMWLLALLALLALLFALCAGMGGLGGIAYWFRPAPTPTPAPVVTNTIDGGVLNGAVMCQDGWNAGSVVNTGSLVHTTIPSGIDDVYYVVELRSTMQDAQGRCMANGATIKAADVLTAVKANPAGVDITMPKWTLVHFGTQRF